MVLLLFSSCGVVPPPPPEARPAHRKDDTMKTLQQRLDAAMSLTAIARAAEVYSDSAAEELNSLHARISTIEAERESWRKDAIFMTNVWRSIMSMGYEDVRDYGDLEGINFVAGEVEARAALLEAK